jgi:biopolymer transport protein ExbB
VNRFLKSAACLVGLAAPGLVLGGRLYAQETSAAFDGAVSSVEARLQASVEELTALRERIAAEKVPMSKRLRELEGELSAARLDFQQTQRLLDGRTLDLSNLRTELKTRQDEQGYLGNLLGEYGRNLESRMHIAELQRHAPALTAAKLAAENTTLSESELFGAQSALLETSIGRLDDALGGARFEGRAVDPVGLVKPGTFAMMGPAVLFRSTDGTLVGVVEQRLGSLEPTAVPFARPETGALAAQLIGSGQGEFPLDPTLGNALKVEATHETWEEHVRKGGAVMIPIFILAGAALLVVLVKWLSMAFVRTPSRRRLGDFLTVVGSGDARAAAVDAAQMGGPVGRMLEAGVQQLGQPREMIEEVMYERVLGTRLSLQRFLPFVAITASSAPLLGLLGTVTGIMNTFTMMTVYGAGDVKQLSSGISEALITTEYGLIVAIPALLIHAFLSRKARRITDEMDRAAVSLLNRLQSSAREPVESAA